MALDLIPFFLQINLFIYLFIYLFLAALGLSWLLRTGFLQLVQAGATLPSSARASHCSGFSCCGAQALGTWASVVVVCGLSTCGSWALERRLSSCGTRAQLLCGMWDLPGPGLEPVSPAVAGGVLTTVPPGKSRSYTLLTVRKLRPRLLTDVFKIKSNIMMSKAPGAQSQVQNHRLSYNAPSVPGVPVAGVQLDILGPLLINL